MVQLSVWWRLCRLKKWKVTALKESLKILVDKTRRCIMYSFAPGLYSNQPEEPQLGQRLPAPSHWGTHLVAQDQPEKAKYVYLVTQSCLTLCQPMDCSPPGSSVHGISQARILVWVAISLSRGSSWPRDRNCVSCVGRQILYHWATRVNSIMCYVCICTLNTYTHTHMYISCTYMHMYNQCNYYV